MSDRVGNPEDRFSRDVTRLIYAMSCENLSTRFATWYHNNENITVYIIWEAMVDIYM